MLKWRGRSVRRWAVYSTYRLDELDTQANWTYPLPPSLPPYTGQTGLSLIQDQSVVKMKILNDTGNEKLKDILKKYSCIKYSL